MYVCRWYTVLEFYPQLLQVVLDGLAEIHSVYWDKRDDLSSIPWLYVMTSERMVQLAPLWMALLNHARSEFPDMWTEERYVCMYIV